MKFTTAEDALRYSLAGKATITLTSLKSGAHFTYKIKRAKDRTTGEPQLPALWFVSLLNGPDNYSNYQYLGVVRPDREAYAFQLTRKSHATEDAPSVKAFRFFFEHAALRNAIPEALEVRHEGACGRCGRKLTVPASIDRGIGPECAEIMGLAARPSADEGPAIGHSEEWEPTGDRKAE